MTRVVGKEKERKGEKKKEMKMKMKKQAGKEKLRLEQSLLVPVSNTD